jgi:predicted Zn-dependent peptidase
MINDLKIMDLAEGVRLHLVQSEKFKTDLIGVYIKRPLSEEEASKNALLTRVLHRGTGELPTSTEVNRRLEELYGSVLIGDVHKYGEKQVLQYKLMVPNKKHLGESVLGEAFDVLREVLRNPYLEDGAFYGPYVDQEKANLKREIMGRKNDKVIYAIERCIEHMCAEEPYRMHEYGSIEALEKIDTRSLYDHYVDIMKTSPIDIVVIGDIDPENVIEKVKENLLWPLEGPVVLERENLDRPVKKVRRYEEALPVKQGKLTLGYRTPIAYESGDFEAALLFSTILGGGASSKLFKNVREEHSLCYYIFSRLDKYKSLMLISSGVDTENVDEALRLIEENVEAMRAGRFSDEEIDMAKKSIVSSTRSISDYPNSFINYYYGHTILESSFDLDRKLDRIQAVTREEIMEAANTFALDTISVIKKEDQEEETV